MKCTIDQLNSWVYPESVCLYQSLIVEKKAFQLEVHGKTFNFISSTTQYNKNVLYFECNDENYSLISNGCADGYKLIIESLVDVALCFTASNTEHIIVRTGHANFAHFIWNQLDPLLKVCNSKGKLFVFQDHNTILDVAQIGLDIKLVDEKHLQSAVSIYLGSRIVSKDVRKVIHKKISKHATDIDLISDKKTIVYLGFRGRSTRGIIGETDMYVDFVKHISSNYSNVVFVFDGFSFQNNNIDDEDAIAVANEVAKKINEVINRCGNDVETINISGLDIFSAWTLIKNIDFFITHEGTMHHKIGWIFPKKRGVILIGGSNAGSIAKWHSNQVEGGCFTEILPLGILNLAKDTPKASRNQTITIENHASIVEKLGDIYERLVEKGRLKSIVQFWHSNDIPPEIQECIASWKSLNPEYQHILFDYARAKTFMEDNFSEDIYKSFSKLTIPAMICDVFRVAYVLKSGGLYVDCATKCIKPIKTWLNEDIKIFLMRKNNGWVWNGLIFANPGNRYIDQLWNIISKNIVDRIDGNIWNLTGPGVFNNVFGTDASEFGFKSQDELKNDFCLVQNLGHKKKGHWSTQQKIEPLYSSDVDLFFNDKYVPEKNMSDVEVIIHIGTHDTFDVSLERFFLSEQITSNYFYPTLGEEGPSHSKIPFILGGNNKNAAIKLRKDFYDEVVASNSKKILITSPYISSTNEVYFNKNCMTRMWSNLEAFLSFFGKVTIVFYLLEQAQSVDVRICKSIESGSITDLRKVIDCWNLPLLEYELFFETLQKYFPNANIHGAIFEGENILNKVIQDISIRYLDTPNSYLSRRLIEGSDLICGGMLELFYKIEMMKISKELKGSIKRKILQYNIDPSLLTALSKADVIRIRERFARGNAKLSEEVWGKVDLQYEFYSSVDKSIQERIPPDEQLFQILISPSNNLNK